ncbi:leucyl aminopeptidase [Paenibacillus sp. GCM10027626]|uniref:leucyl aminopeptidase n=1 Tax=Paenibacillus sp. GCM10027626 TaxID=3273411 RepID=UPI003637B59C
MSGVMFTYAANGVAGKDAEAVIALVSKAQLQQEQSEEAWIHPQLDEALRARFAKQLFKAEDNEVYVMPTLGLIASEHVIFVGINAWTAGSLRDAATAAAKAAKRVKAGSAALRLPAGLCEDRPDCSVEQTAQALTEGFSLGLYKRKTEKTKSSAEEANVQSVFYEAGNDAQAASGQWEAGIKRGSVFADSVVFARNLVNLPGNRLTPELLALEAEALATAYGIDIEVIDEWTAAEQGMGGLLGVGQGSANPPRMIVFHYEGDPGSQEVWGMIGKGITFDTGGISLKPGAGMETMICDMGGAASILGMMRIVGELKPKVNIVAVIPSAENMPSDRAYKPGDVLNMMNGMTVEVVNTDAEGRLVLADGLTTAIRRGATKLVDVATLTGAVGVALGNLATGAVTNNEALLEEIMTASERAGERIWQLPAYPEYRKQLDSDAADLKNAGGRQAGTITGGLFIGAFAEERPWVHLDIAATAWLDSERSWEPKGGTGVMVRTLGELLLKA